MDWIRIFSRNRRLCGALFVVVLGTCEGCLGVVWSLVGGLRGGGRQRLLRSAGVSIAAALGIAVKCICEMAGCVAIECWGPFIWRNWCTQVAKIERYLTFNGSQINRSCV